MLGSCARQGTRPNPANEESLRELWRAFSGKARLSFAHVGGQVTAGLLCILHGTRMTLWKKGWLSSNADCHPNELLNYDALRWASQNGYQHCDFAGFDRAMAEPLLKGLPLSEAQIKTRHFFNLRFGAKPEPLPEARVFVFHPLPRVLYAAATRFRFTRALLSRLRQAARSGL